MTYPTKKLGDIIALEYGKPLPSSKRREGGKYPVYGANGIKDRADVFYYDKPSIILGRKGSAGELALVKEPFWPLDVTYYVTFDERVIDLQFLFNLFQTLELKKLARGVKPGINRNDVYSIDIPLPPLPEQKRIVKILDEVFENIEKAKENTEKNLRNAKELFEAYLNGVFANPGEGWEYCALNDYVRFIDYRGRTPAKTKSGIRLITAKNIKKGYLQKEPEEFIAHNAYKSWMTRGIPLKGDVLFTTEAPLANVAQLDTDEKVAFAQRTIIFQPDRNQLSPTFLKYLLLSSPIQKRILEKGTGATVKGIKASLLKKIEIYFPDVTEQLRIIAKLDSLSAETKKLEAIYQKKLDDLDELKKSVLKKAFSGEL